MSPGERKGLGRVEIRFRESKGGQDRKAVLARRRKTGDNLTGVGKQIGKATGGRGGGGGSKRKGNTRVGGQGETVIGRWGGGVL